MNQKIKQALKKLEPFKRTAYIPKIQISLPTFSAASKIGGLPFLRSEQDWPTCPNCKKHMHLFLQLNLEDLPERASEGLIQLFYCTTDEPDCNSDLCSWEAFSKGSVCRKFQVTDGSMHIMPLPDAVFEERQIVGWEAKDDYPHYEDYDLLGIDSDLIDDELFEEMEEEEVGMPLEGDKLFGHPRWVQGSEYPVDRKTGALMGLLFQLDSEVNLPFMFGDSGIGHLTQSPDNEEELGFAWACY